MKIAQVAPLFESVPPKCYGGTERVVSYLTEELVRQGHEVVLFASGDSVSRASLVSACPRSLRLDPACRDVLAHHVLLTELVAKRAPEFDIVHYHIDYVHFSVSRRLATPHITTLHGRLDLPDLENLYREFCDTPLASISDAQREPLPFANWQATVYHGLPADLYHLREDPEDYLAFVGRVSPEKGIDRAIEIAKRVGMTLKIAAKVDKVDEQFFEQSVKSLLDHPGIEFLGEQGESEKNVLLGGARALLFPIDWPEPFGLVMIEALACGTPVIAFRHGSVPEVIKDGVTGFIVENVDDAVAAVGHLASLDRLACRATFEERFPATRMANDYLGVYKRLIREGRGDVARTDAQPAAALA